MAYDFERSIDDVVDRLRHAKERKGAVILLGAGCSKTAGIPLATDFEKIIKERYPLDYKRAKRLGKTSYQHLMAEISAGERRDLLAEYIDNAKLNWAHIAFAELVKEGYIARVLTPNFDPLVVQACALLNEFPAIYDFAASQTFKPDFVPTPAVYYLHGQRSGFRLLNTESECRDHAEQLRPVFEEAGAKRPWIVLGYSGENDPVFDYLLSGATFDYRLYWIGYRSDEPARHLTEHLLKEDRQAFFVPGFDSDSFLVQLADRLGCFPPDLVSRPFTHLSSTFDLIGAYEQQDRDGNPVDLLGQARMLVQTAIETLEKEPESPEAIQEKLLTAVRARYISGDYEEAVRIAESAPTMSPELYDLLSWVQSSWGNALSDQALRKEGRESDDLFAESYAKFARAVEIKEDKHEAFYNWGIALSEQAFRKEGQESDDLFAESYAKYARAVEIKEDKHLAFNNWGFTLYEQALRKEGQESDDLFAASYGKYARAVEIKEDDHDAFNNWGNALSDQALRKEGQESDDLFAESYEKYARAVEIKEDKHEAFNNWGIALKAQALRKESQESDDLFGAAYEKYARAVEIKEDKHEAFYNWGIALSDQALRKEGQESDDLFAESYEKYARAVEIKEDKHEAFNNWGIALSDQALRKEGQESDDLFGAAYEKYARAVEIKEDKHDAFNNWGTALKAQALRKEGRESDDLIVQAEERLLKAVELEPEEVYNLACVRVLQGKIDEAQKLLGQAMDFGTLPSNEHMMEDSDLDGIRDEEWFKELMDGRD